jgi:hypothetical protein
MYVSSVLIMKITLALKINCRLPISRFVNLPMTGGGGKITLQADLFTATAEPLGLELRGAL